MYTSWIFLLSTSSRITSWVNMMKSCWTIHFQIVSPKISKCFDKMWYLKEKCSFCPQQNGKSIILSFELSPIELEANLLDQKPMNYLECRWNPPIWGWELVVIEFHFDNKMYLWSRSTLNMLVIFYWNFL